MTLRTGDLIHRSKEWSGNRPLAPSDGSEGLESSGDAYFRAASAVLASRPDPIEDGLLAGFLGRHYALSGRIEMLSSEVEQTAETVLPDGRRLILKASRTREARDSFRFQSAALAALDGARGFLAPRVLLTTDGASMFEEDSVTGYLQTRAPGSPLHLESKTPDILYRTGAALGHLDRTLHGRELPAMHRPVLWHISCWPRLAELRRHLIPGPVADAVDDAMAQYVEHVEPEIGALDWQVVHNDPSPFNTLTTGAEIAFIDFGDGGWGPRIQDLAIAASHVVSDPSLPLGGAEHLIAGYWSVLPLSEREVALLVGLMKARQSALILINHWRADLFPNDAAYIKKNVARAEKGLSILAALNPGAGRRAVARSSGET